MPVFGVNMNEVVAAVYNDRMYILRSMPMDRRMLDKALQCWPWLAEVEGLEDHLLSYVALHGVDILQKKPETVLWAVALSKVVPQVAQHIELLGAQPIIAGCGDGKYCLTSMISTAGHVDIYYGLEQLGMPEVFPFFVDTPKSVDEIVALVKTLVLVCYMRFDPEEIWKNCTECALACPPKTPIGEWVEFLRRKYMLAQALQDD